MRLAAFSLLIAAVLLPAAATGAPQSAQGGAAITGLVVDADSHAPVTGARVMLLPAPTAGRLTGPPGIPSQAVTGDDGVYTLSGVTPGQYRMQVQKPGFVPPTPADTTLFNVGAGQVITGPELRLVKGAVIAGRVLDGRGEPLTDVMVTAMRKPPGGARGRGAPAIPAGQPGQTNDIGEFRIPGLPAGEYYVAANPRPSPFTQSSSVATSPVTTFYPGVADLSGAQAIAVAAGQTVSGMEFTMLSARAFTVSGVVVDEMNRPVDGVMVVLIPAQVVGPGPRGSDRTRSDGTFKIGGVAAGAYRLNASVPVTIPTGGTVVTGGVVGGATSGSGSIVSYSSLSGPASMVPVNVADADVAGVTVVVRQR